MWSLFALLALRASGLSTFAVPNERKQPPLHLQRQKEGLDVYQSAGAEFYDAINLPGVRIEPTKEEHRLASRIKASGNGEPGQWSQVQQILSEYSGYSPLVLNAAMRAALNSRMYPEGARLFERLRRSNAPITLPVYPTALKLYGKLHDEGEVRKLWKELVHFEAVNYVVAQACIDAYADNGNITGAAEVLEYLENNTIQMNARHFTSAINACANSKENYRARAAKFLLEKLLEKGLQPSIITYSCVVRSMQQSEGQELLDLVSNMTAQGVKANNVFAENFFYQFLKQPKKGSWTSKAAVVADLRKLPRENLKRAKDVMNEFLAAGVELNASCRRIKAALESLL